MIVRDGIYQFLSEELVGPRPQDLPFVQVNGEEVLPPDEPPRSRYGAGILFPSRVETAAQESEGGDQTEGPVEDEVDDEGSLGGENPAAIPADLEDDGNSQLDQEVNRANQFLPSALGITVLMEPPEELVINIRAAQYAKEEFPGKQAPGGGNRNRDGEFVPYHPWFRMPLDQEVRFPGQELLAEGEKVLPARELDSYNEGTALKLHIYSRPAPREYGLGNGVRFVTFTLLNDTEGGDAARARDEHCFFQTGLEINSAGGEACFRNYPGRREDQEETEEERSLALLYRKQKSYAVGHGCAPDWDETDPVEGRAKAIRTTSLPRHEMVPIVPSSLEGLNLHMEELAREDPLSPCHQLAERYASWIEERRAELQQQDNVPYHLKEIADRHLGRCEECLGRIRRGIDVLEATPQAMDAFRRMNEAMLLQQLHYGLTVNKPRNWEFESGELRLEKPFEAPNTNGTSNQWRPFQLAFILMTIPSMVLQEEAHFEERDLVDVIWFPTGGGKTEAYLGLAAFTIFLRRLRDPADAGTTAIMRYTLRLLTTQQFQRAASLICAAEIIRREEPEALGEERITIGLWVGSAVTPNSEKKALTALQNLTQGEQDNPFIVLNCPWCGAQMGPVKASGSSVKVKGYRKLRRPQRVRLQCEDPDCAFSEGEGSEGEGLPLQVIDEHLYEEPPTLVIGTVDKFALLPWKPEARSLFGMGERAYSPPELIIQDELHLIAGPLGSMVGHYETIIDALSRRNQAGREVPAKIVASTATISRAGEQVAALYGRSRERTKLFPPQGLEVGESFFSEQNDQERGREYVGVFGSGFPSQVTTQVRVMSALLQAPAMEEASNKELDPYWTLMTYFNSIRELGHAATLIQADIREYLKAMRKRLGVSKAWGPEWSRFARWVQPKNTMELTSRIHNSEVPGVLQRLFHGLEEEGQTDPVDICLATNMIQVGLDVPRLGVMAVVGQPKSTAEYIQATSRIGREKPGLVVTVLNPGKPRDRSHFERFPEFHQSIYRFVEPTSVTPFAVPVRDRALHALVVALCRFWGPASLRDYPDPPPDEELKEKVRKYILERVREVDDEEEEETDRQIQRIFRHWEHRPPDTYGRLWDQPEELPLMYPAGQPAKLEWNEQPYPTPTSMRSVDAECKGKPLASYLFADGGEE